MADGAGESNPTVEPTIEEVSVVTSSDDLDFTTKLNRYIYLGNAEGIYISGCPFSHNYFAKERLSFLDQFIGSADQRRTIGNVIETAADAICLFGEAAVPRRSTLIYALAYCCRMDNPQMRELCYPLLPKCCTNIDEFILFIKFCFDLTDKGWGEGMRKAVNRWYLNKEPLELAKILSSCKSRHGWSHKDILCLSRPNPADNIKKFLMTYAVKGYKEFHKRVLNDEAHEQLIEMEPIKYIIGVHNFRATQDADVAIKLYKEHNLSYNHVPQSLLQDKDFMLMLIPELAIHEILRLLLQLNRRKSKEDKKKQQNANSKKTKPKNTNETNELWALIKKDLKKRRGNIEASIKKNVHLFELVILKYNYAVGHKPWKHQKQKHADTKQQKHGENIKPAPGDDHLNQTIITRFFTNLGMANPKTPTAQIFLTLDFPREKGNEDVRCFQNAHVPIRVAMAAIVCYLKRGNKNLQVALFDGDLIKKLNKATIPMNVDKIRETLIATNTRPAKSMSSPLVSLMIENDHKSFRNKKAAPENQYWVFINVIISEKAIRSKSKIPILDDPVRALMAYRKSFTDAYKASQAKLITISLGDKDLNIAKTARTRGCIDIVGFDENVPAIIESFIHGHYY